MEDSRLTHLLQAAETIFLAKGYHTATMADVAKAAGMSKKTVYRIVSSKAGLFVALLSYRHSFISFPKPPPEWEPKQILIENLRILAKFMLSKEQIAIVRMIMAEYTHSPDLVNLFHQKRVTKALSILETCLANYPVCRGQPAMAREMSEILFGMVLGEFLLSTMIGFRSLPSKATLERRIHLAVDLFLAACLSSAQPANIKRMA